MSLEKGGIEYSSPEESFEESGEPYHRFNLVIEGKTVGTADIEYRSKPLPYYKLTDLRVNSEFRGQGYGGGIMEQVEEFLLSRKKPGILVDAISTESATNRFYEKRGWQLVPGSVATYAFNWPPDVPMDIALQNPYRYTPGSDRKNTSQDTPSL